ncbi:hypothetical protein ABKY47_004011 [Aeromonas hydrophila]
MKIQEIHVVFNCLDGTTELSRSSSLDGIKIPEQPYEVALIRLMFEGGYMFQVDDELSVIEKDGFKVVYCNCEPENLVIHGDGGSDEPAGYDGSVITLLSEYQCPIGISQYIGMHGGYIQTIMKLKPFKRT